MDGLFLSYHFFSFPVERGNHTGFVYYLALLTNLLLTPPFFFPIGNRSGGSLGTGFFHIVVWALEFGFTILSNLKTLRGGDGAIRLFVADEEGFRAEDGGVKAGSSR